MSDVDIEFGYTPPGYGTYDSTEPMLEVAKEAENAGFDTLWTGEHITIPEELDYEEYQFGVPDWADISNPSLDTFGKFSYISAVTEEITMANNILIAPLRHPILLAKQALTVSALSDGRFELGVGAGWLRSEFEVLDAPYEKRGLRTDEFLELFDLIFENDGETGFEGETINFRKTGFHPIPDEKPKIWIGGTSSSAIRRTAEYGDGWTVVNHTPEEVSSFKSRMMNAWSDYDRDGEPEIAARTKFRLGETDGEAPENAAVGSPDDIVAHIEEYADAGTTHVILGSMTETLEEELEQIQRFGEEVIPKFA